MSPQFYTAVRLRLVVVYLLVALMVCRMVEAGNILTRPKNNNGYIEANEADNKWPLVTFSNDVIQNGAGASTEDSDEGFEVAANYDTNSYDFFLLVMTWPETFCEERTSCKIPTKVKGFSLHGLWPEREDGHWPQYCPGPKFSKLSLLTLLPRLLRFWANMLPRTPMFSFWQHEWSRHGVCAIRNNPKLTSQRQYFKAAMDLFRKYEPLKVWKTHNIDVPSNSKTFNMDSLIGAYKDSFGVTPVIACGRQSQDRQHIGQVTVCINKDLTIRECPEAIQRRSCPQHSAVKLPILNYK